MNQTDGHFEGSEGLVFYRRWDPPLSAVRIVLIAHGYAEHGGRYAHVADALTRNGAVVYAPDHIGHGRSDGDRALITDFDHVVDDLHQLAGIARSAHPGLPVVLVGHSMGGLIAGRFAERWPGEVAGVAFCGAVIGDWAWARDVLTRPELPHVEFDPGALSRDPGVGAAYAADPAVYHGQYRRGLLEAEVEALDAFQSDITRLDMPVLMMHGTDDPFVPYLRSLRAVREMPTDDVTIHLYDGARHEVLNEVDRDGVIGDLDAWVGRFRGQPAAIRRDPGPSTHGHVGAAFSARPSAEAAAAALRAAGLADADFEAAVHEPGSHVFEDDVTEEIAHGVERGMAIGVPIGAVVGALFVAAIAAAAGAGIGISVVVAGVMAGGFVGSYFGGFVGFAAEAPAMAEELDWELVHLSPEETLLVVGEHGNRNQVEQILAAHGGRAIHPTHHPS